MATQYILKRDGDTASFKIDYQKELNEQQLQVVLHGDGPCLVLAGAGSGKTRTIVYRVAYLLERGVRPEEILLVTFTNKAARQMLLRIEELLKVQPKGLWGGTFHHVANLILRKYGNAIGYPANFSILDDDDSKSLIELCRKDVIGDKPKERFPSKAVLQDIYSLAANTEQTVADVLESVRPDLLKHSDQILDINARYEKRKRDSVLLSFDDLLTQTRRLLLESDEVRQKLAGQFRYVLVDEYQDTNTIQADIVERLSSVHRNLLVVGDDAQSIYSFRGADIQNILGFPKREKGTTISKLETNYRSTKPILDLANNIIKHNGDQFMKILHHIQPGEAKPQLVPTHTSGQEADFIAQMVLERHEEGIPLKEMAVLFRASYQSQELEFELTRRDIPYEYRGGVRFFERAHIKDVLSFLKLLEHPKDELALLRTLTMQVGIGPAAVTKLRSTLDAFPRLPEDFLNPDLRTTVPERAQKGIFSFQGVMKRLLAADRNKPGELVTSVTESIGYREYLFNEYTNAEDRLQDLQQLARFAEHYSSVTDFLAEVSLQESFAVETDRQSATETDKMVLTTIHQAKGLEWNTVFIMNLVEPGFPNPKAAADRGGLEEERRLFYVAVTRAKEKLILSYPLATDMRAGGGYLIRPSQFVTELPRDMFEHIDLVEELPSIQLER